LRSKIFVWTRSYSTRLKQQGIRRRFFLFYGRRKFECGRVLVRMSRGGQAVPVSTVIDSYRESSKNLSEVPNIRMNYWCTTTQRIAAASA